jgi:hypothetical protein
MADLDHPSSPQSDCFAGADNPNALIADLDEQLRTTARAYCAALAELAPLAERLASLEAHLCATRHRAGVRHEAKPPVGELASDVAFGQLQSLRPHVAFVGAEALARAEQARLRSPSTPSLPERALRPRDTDG